MKKCSQSPRNELMFIQKPRNGVAGVQELMKDRLEERDFGHVRHHCYRKNLVEPTGVDSLAHMDPKCKEFWRTNVERVLKQDEEKRRKRQKVWHPHHEMHSNSLIFTKNKSNQTTL